MSQYMARRKYLLEQIKVFEKMSKINAPAQEYIEAQLKVMHSFLMDSSYIDYAKKSFQSCVKGATFDYAQEEERLVQEFIEAITPYEIMLKNEAVQDEIVAKSKDFLVSYVFFENVEVANPELEKIVKRATSGVLTEAEINALNFNFVTSSFVLSNGQRVGFDKDEMFQFLASRALFDGAFCQELKDVLKTDKIILFLPDAGSFENSTALGEVRHLKLEKMLEVVRLKNNSYISDDGFQNLRHELRHVVTESFFNGKKSIFFSFLNEADARSIDFLINRNESVVFSLIYDFHKKQVMKSEPLNAFEIEAKTAKKARADYINLLLSDPADRFHYYKDLFDQGVAFPEEFFPLVEKHKSYEKAKRSSCVRANLKLEAFLDDVMFLESEFSLWVKTYKEDFVADYHASEPLYKVVVDIQDFLNKNYGPKARMSKHFMAQALSSSYNRPLLAENKKGSSQRAEVISYTQDLKRFLGSISVRQRGE